MCYIIHLFVMAKKKSTEFNQILLFGVITIALIVMGYYGFKSIYGSSAANNIINGDLGNGIIGNGITPTKIDVTASLDPSSPAAHIVLGGQVLFDDVAKYKFTATGSGFTVQKLAILIPNEGWVSVDMLKIEYKNKLGQTVSKTVSVYAEKSKFTGLSLYVPKNGSSTMTVKATFKKVITGGGKFGAHIKFGLASGAVAGDFYAVPDPPSIVSADTRAANQDIYAAEHVLYDSMPYVTASNPSGTGTIVPGAVNDLYKFKVTADAAGAVAVKRFTFSIFITDASTTTASSADLGGFTFLRNGIDITASGAQITQISNDGATYLATPLSIETDDTNDLENNTSYWVQVTFANTPATDPNGEQIIDAGQTVLFTLRAIAGTGFTTTDAFATVLLGDQATDPGMNSVYLTDLDFDLGVQQIIGLQTAAGIQLHKSMNFVWSDRSVLAHLPTFDDDGVIETSSKDWTQGYLVKNFPLAVYGYTL